MHMQTLKIILLPNLIKYLRATTFIMVAEFLLLLPAYAQRISDAEQEGLKGQVHTIREEIAILKPLTHTSQEQKRTLARTVAYGPTGDIINEFTPGPLPYHLYSSYRFLGAGIYNRIILNTANPSNRATLSWDDFSVPGNDLLTNSVTIWKYVYDLAGRPSEAYRYGPSKGSRLDIEVLRVSAKILYEYNRAGICLVSKTLYNTQGRLIYSWHCSCDSSDNITVQVKATKRHNRLVRKSDFYTYEFDDVGNWIKKVTSKRLVNRNGKPRLVPVEITYRSITYYERVPQH
jgi:hypothetical protein